MNTTISPPSDGLDSLVGRLADEFSDRLARGEKPDVEAYAGQHPEAADELRRVLRSVEVLHALKLDSAGQGGFDASGQMALGELGDFRILREVGRGGMGIVYEAEQLSLCRRVALKVLPFASVLDPKLVKRFQNEALAAAHLDHPNIISVYGTGCERGVYFYAMRFIDGRTLADVIRELRARQPRSLELTQDEADSAPEADRLRSTADFQQCEAPAARGTTSEYYPRPCSLTSAADTSPQAALSTHVSIASAAFFRSIANIGLQVAGALEHAHQCGILHRDIKPGNLLLAAEGTVWISDFGLAHMGTDANLTMSGDLVGTLRYMSPEQALANRVAVDHRSDIYSLGVTLYEMLTLRPPFDGRDREELLRQIAFEEPVAPRRINRAIPADLETIVLKAMAKNPNERYAMARAMADDLHCFLADRPIQARRPGPAQRLAKWSRRHRAVVRTAAASLAVALVTLAVVEWGERRQTAAAYEQAVVHQQLAEQQRDQAEQERERAESLRKLAEERELAARQYLYAAQLTLAQHASEKWHVGRAVELLDAQRPREGKSDLRGFEWYYLWNQCQGERYVLQAHGDPVFAMAVSPDGHTLATAGTKNTIVLWDIGSRRLRAKLSWPDVAVTALAFAPDNKTLAAAAASGMESEGNGRVKIWDTHSGKDIKTFESPGFQITSLAFSPDGTMLASGETALLNTFPARGHLTLWDPATGLKVRTCDDTIPLAQPWGLDAVSSVAFSPDGKVLAGCSGQRRLPGGGSGGSVPAEMRFWDPATGQQRDGRKIDFAASALAYSPDGKTLAIAGVRGVRLYDAATITEQAILKSGPGVMWSITFSSDGRTLATANADDTVRLWDVASRTNFARKLHRHAANVAFVPGSQTLVSAGGDTINLWAIGRPATHAVWKAHEESVTAVAWSADGKRLVSSSYDGTSRAWDADSGKVALTLDQGVLARVQVPAPGVRIRSMAISPDGRWAVMGGDQLQLWDVAAGRFHSTLQGHVPWVMAVAFSPDSSVLASADADGELKLWNTATGAELASWHVYPPIKGIGPIFPGVSMWNGSGNYVTSLAFSSDGKIFAAAGLKGVKLWDAKTWRSLPDLRNGTEGHVLCSFSPDGKLLATAKATVMGVGEAVGGTGAEVILWDIATGTSTTTIRAHGFTPSSLAFSPDGRTLAIGGIDEIKLWSVSTGQELLTLAGHAGLILSVAFDSSGEALASGGSDGTVRVWRAPRTGDVQSRK
jgi:WD40 repeat protein/serine/threonine protein kinase